MPNCEATIGEEKDIIRQKIKINKLIDKCEELEKEIRKKDAINERLMIENKKLSNQANVPEDYSEENELLKTIKNLNYIVARLARDNAIIPYKNYTKNSLRYCKVEKTVFDSYMDKYVSMDKKLFLNRCVEIGFFKSNDDGKFVFNDNQMRIYFLSKAMLSLISGDLNC